MGLSWLLATCLAPAVAGQLLQGPLYDEVAMDSDNPLYTLPKLLAPSPTCGDFDADGILPLAPSPRDDAVLVFAGDQDCLVGTESGAIAYWLNTGSARAPNFTAVPVAQNPMSNVAMFSYAAPDHADLDHDGMRSEHNGRTS